MRLSPHFPLTVLLILACIATFHSCRKDEMKVETTDVTQIMATTATALGSIIDLGDGVEQHGHCWDTTANPSINSSKTENGTATQAGIFTSQLTDLEVGRIYHIRAYLQTSNVVVYGKDMTFITRDGEVILTTTDVTNTTIDSAVSGGNIASVNGDTVLSRGVCWDTLETVSLIIKAGFTINGSGKGSFTSELTGLLIDQIYYVKAYAISSVDTSYGAARRFATRNGHGMITTGAVQSVTATTAIINGSIIFDGGTPITACGMCYGTSENPTIDDNTINSTVMAYFTSSLSDLSPNTAYYVRAYATNVITTSYSDQQRFLTTGLPEVITANAISDITNGTATCGGNVITDWGYPVTSRGVCWSTSQDPTTADTRTIDGSGSGSFTSNISGLSGLTQGVTYYVRAYATNSVGTSYGKQLSLFVTAIVDVINPFTGKTWMDRNLGAGSTRGGGDYYQWGRGSDGHEKIRSGITTTLSSSDTPGHGLFIIGGSDWRSPQNDNLWQGVNGINNPCPGGYRLPTEAEWVTERNSWIEFNEYGAYNTPLRLSSGGNRIPTSRLEPPPFEGSDCGYYWSSTVDGSSVRCLYFEHYGSAIISRSRSRGQSVRCIKDYIGIPVISTSGIWDRTNSTATCGGTVVEDGGYPVTERGVCWSTSPNPTTADSRTTDGSGTGSFTSNLSGLTQTDTYYVRAYATNSAGTAYGEQRTFTLFVNITVVEVTNPATGKTWMDRNLGAGRAAISSTDSAAYGDLYQWGRDSDGHQKRTSGTTNVLSNSDTPGHGNFIIFYDPYGTGNWRRPVNDSLWQGARGVNNPCPNGYRLPTEAEWVAERNSWINEYGTGAFSSPLKLTVAGYRYATDGKIGGAGHSGCYWSSTVRSTFGYLYFGSSIFKSSPSRRSGHSVRCIKN